MKAKLKGLGTENLSISGEIPSFKVDEQELFVLSNTFEVVLEAVEKDGLLKFSAEILGKYDYICSRCLEKYSEDKKIVTTFYAVEESKIESIIDEDIDYFTYKNEDEFLDFTETLKEIIVINGSVKPICKNDCKGLCSFCGIDLNKKTCSCKDSEIDPRWAKLTEIKEQMKNKES